MEFRGNPGAASYPIGEVEILEAFEVTNRGFETASWYETLRCEPQTVTLWSNGYYVSYGVEGVVIDAYFGSSWGGVALGGYDKERDTGKTSRYTYTYYSYAWAESRMEGTLPADRLFHMLPEYGVGCAPYDHDPSKIGHFLTMPDAGHPLQVKRLQTKRGSGYYPDATYEVTFRGQRLGEFIVNGSEGFNGDTFQPAIRKALDLAKELI